MRYQAARGWRVRRRSRNAGIGSSEKGWGMLASGEDGLDGEGEAVPGGGEGVEAVGTGGGERVIDAAAAGDSFAGGGEGSGALESVEDGVNDALADGDDGSGAVADGLDDLVAVHLMMLEELEDEELGYAVHEVRIGVAGCHSDEYTLWF
jgi:hypothetical protein